MFISVQIALRASGNRKFRMEAEMTTPKTDKDESVFGPQGDPVVKAETASGLTPSVQDRIDEIHEQEFLAKSKADAEAKSK